MKKLLMIVTALVLTFVLSGCSSSEPTYEERIVEAVSNILEITGENISIEPTDDGWIVEYVEYRWDTNDGELKEYYEKQVILLDNDFNIIEIYSAESDRVTDLDLDNVTEHYDMRMVYTENGILEYECEDETTCESFDDLTLMYEAYINDGQLRIHYYGASSKTTYVIDNAYKYSIFDYWIDDEDRMIQNFYPLDISTKLVYTETEGEYTLTNTYDYVIVDELYPDVGEWVETIE